MTPTTLAEILVFLQYLALDYDDKALAYYATTLLEKVKGGD